VSAVKVDGARAYDLAREGEVMELAARPLHVASLEVIATDPEGVELEMVCGKGGYVRSIARDLGRALGCLGHVAWLRRVWSGPFDAEDGLSLEEIERLARSPELEAKLHPLDVGLDGLTELPCNDLAVTLLRNGNPAEVLQGAEFGEECWVSHKGQAIAIGIYRAGMVHPSRVFQL
jgi:tRNA pseudouridine55 synthase